MCIRDSCGSGGTRPFSSRSSRCAATYASTSASKAAVSIRRAGPLPSDLVQTSGEAPRAPRHRPRRARARTGQESDPTPPVGQRVIGDDPELLERVDPGGTDGARMIRDNPRVPWALRDLCNPWTWAYSAFRDPDGNAFSITETA